MFNHKNQILIIASIITSPLTAKNFVDDFFEAEKKVMEKAHAGAKEVMKEVDSGLQKAQNGLEKAGQEIKKAGQEVKQAIVSALETKLQVSIQENDKDNTVAITVNGIKAEKIDATLNDENDTLTIKADNSKVLVYAKDRTLTVAVRQEVSTKSEDSKLKAQSFSAASMQESRTMSGTVNLDKQTITYDQAKEELTITLPMAAKKAGKPVTVNVIGKQNANPVVAEKAAEAPVTAPVALEKPAETPVK